MFEIKFTFKTRKNNELKLLQKKMQQQFQEKCNNMCWLKFPFKMYDGRNALCKLINAAMLLGQQTKREINTHKQQTIATNKQQKMQQTTNITIHITERSICPQTYFFNLHCLIVIYILLCTLLILTIYG